MAILCSGALLAGLIAALLMPFLPFACAVVAALVIGGASTLLEGGSLARILLSMVALLVCAQLGYGLGMVAAAGIGHASLSMRRLAGGKRSARLAQALRPENEPR